MDGLQIIHAYWFICRKGKFFEWYDLIIFDFIIILKFAHTIYVQNQVFTIFKSQLIDNLELFWTKQSFSFYTKSYGWYPVWWYYEWPVKNMKIPHNLILSGYHL